MKPQTVVVISHICPYPATHGIRRRVGQLLGWLKREGYRVVFVMQPMDVESPAHIREVRVTVDELIVVPRRVGSERLRWWARTAALFPFKVMFPSATRSWLRSWGRPPERTGSSQEVWLEYGDIDERCWPSTIEMVKKVVQRERPFAVFAEYVTMSRCLVGLPPGPLKIIDTCEVYHRNHEVFIRERISSGFTCRPETERMGLLRADVLLGIQENDSSALRRLVPELPVHTLGYANPVVGSSLREPLPGRILYVGSTNHFNRRSLELFLRDGWEPIRAAFPQAVLHVVGDFPELAASGPRDVVFVGRITDDELAREYASAQVVLNPQVAGTGLKIKCIEAMANGCALVVRGAGTDGLEAGAGSAFLVAENWEEFSEAVVSLLVDPIRRRHLEESALAFVRSQFSELVVFGPLKILLASHARRSPGSLAA